MYHVHVITTFSATNVYLSPSLFLSPPSHFCFLPPSLSLSLRPHSHYRAVVRVHTHWTGSLPTPVGQRSTTPQRVCGMTPHLDCTTTSPLSLNLLRYKVHACTYVYTVYSTCIYMYMLVCGEFSQL